MRAVVDMYVRTEAPESHPFPRGLASDDHERSCITRVVSNYPCWSRSRPDELINELEVDETPSVVQRRDC